MTSKEALNNIRDYNTELIHDVGCEYIENPLEEECNIIKKDLERLALLEKAVDILKPYCYIEWDEANDAFYFNVDASERIPLSEDYDVNRCIIGISDSEIDILKEVF